MEQITLSKDQPTTLRKATKKPISWALDCIISPDRLTPKTASTAKPKPIQTGLVIFSLRINIPKKAATTGYIEEILAVKPAPIASTA